MKKKIWIAIITFLLIVTFAFPSLAGSSGFNKMLPLAGIHEEIATGTRASTTTKFKAQLTYFKEEFTGNNPSSTDRAIFFAQWNYKAGDHWKKAAEEIWLKEGADGSTPYTQGGRDYRCKASTSWLNASNYRIKGTVWF